jgi:HrpA-like RNA helicase
LRFAFAICLRVQIPTLKDFARTRGKTLRQLGVAGNFASMVNVGRQRAGSKAIAAIAASLGEPAERIAAICDQCWQAGEARRAAAASLPTSPESSCPQPDVVHVG